MNSTKGYKGGVRRRTYTSGHIRSSYVCQAKSGHSQLLDEELSRQSQLKQQNRDWPTFVRIRVSLSGTIASDK